MCPRPVGAILHHPYAVRTDRQSAIRRSCDPPPAATGDSAGRSSSGRQTGVEPASGSGLARDRRSALRTASGPSHTRHVRRDGPDRPYVLSYCPTPRRDCVGSRQNSVPAQHADQLAFFFPRWPIHEVLHLRFGRRLGADVPDTGTQCDVTAILVVKAERVGALAILGSRSDPCRRRRRRQLAELPNHFPNEPPDHGYEECVRNLKPIHERKPPKRRWLAARLHAVPVRACTRVGAAQGTVHTEDKVKGHRDSFNG